MSIETASHFMASAGVRYWEDATVNGIEDEDGSRIPCRLGDYWCPTIDLATGTILNWPEGTTADIHYKVCDDGEYWLADAEGNKLARRKGYYVPNDFLCHGDKGYGDYIILTVGPDGKIAEYQRPAIDASEWKAVARAEDSHV